MLLLDTDAGAPPAQCRALRRHAAACRRACAEYPADATGVHASPALGEASWACLLGALRAGLAPCLPARAPDDIQWLRRRGGYAPEYLHLGA